MVGVQGVVRREGVLWMRGQGGSQLVLWLGTGRHAGFFDVIRRSTSTRVPWAVGLGRRGPLPGELWPGYRTLASPASPDDPRGAATDPASPSPTPPTTPPVMASYKHVDLSSSRFSVTEWARWSWVMLRKVPGVVQRMPVTVRRKRLEWQASGQRFRRRLGDPEERRVMLTNGRKMVKETAAHYWTGTKLLWADIRIGTSLLRRRLQGHDLTRRERKQLVRTAADLARMVPFLFMIILPAGEFLLPFFLRMFPNMLPSTFEETSLKEEKRRKTLLANLELAKFVQDSMKEVAGEIQARRKGTELGADAENFTQFMNRVKQGHPVSDKDILRFSSLFDDDITLDNIARPQLVALNRFLGLNAAGSDAYLRETLEQHMREIKQEDMQMRRDGLAQFTTPELRVAVKDRGMRHTGPRSTLLKEMEAWLEISGSKVPPLLLIMSRIVTITDPDHLSRQLGDPISLQQAMNTLPDHVVDVVGAELPSESSEMRRRELEVLRAQQTLINKERAESVDVKEDLELVIGDRLQKLKAIVDQAVASASSSEHGHHHHPLGIQPEVVSELQSALSALEHEEGLTLPAWKAAGAEASDLRALNQLKQSAERLTAKVVQQSSNDLAAIAHLGDTVRLLDADRDGIITREELSGLLDKIKDKATEEEKAMILDIYDDDKDGFITLNHILEKADMVDEATQLGRPTVAAAPALVPAAGVTLGAQHAHGERTAPPP